MFLPKQSQSVNRAHRGHQGSSSPVKPAFLGLATTLLGALL